MSRLVSRMAGRASQPVKRMSQRNTWLAWVVRCDSPAGLLAERRRIIEVAEALAGAAQFVSDLMTRVPSPARAPMPVFGRRSAISRSSGLPLRRTGVKAALGAFDQLPKPKDRNISLFAAAYVAFRVRSRSALHSFMCTSGFLVCRLCSNWIAPNIRCNNTHRDLVECSRYLYTN